jgi:hypothetical protein
LSSVILINYNFSIAASAAVDSDNDGWPDLYEEKPGTDPTDPDTANDNLSDFQEVT